MTDWCDDCAWPEACSASRECARREAREAQAASLAGIEQTLRRQRDARDILLCGPPVRRPMIVENPT
jgi:hypothetical protein